MILPFHNIVPCRLWNKLHNTVNSLNPNVQFEFTLTIPGRKRGQVPRERQPGQGTSASPVRQDPSLHTQEELQIYYQWPTKTGNNFKVHHNRTSNSNRQYLHSLHEGVTFSIHFLICTGCTLFTWLPGACA